MLYERGKGMIIVDENALHMAISTLKTIDVRGFDSMDKLVGVVMLLTRVTEGAPRVQEEPKPAGEEKKDGTD